MEEVTHKFNLHPNKNRLVLLLDCEIPEENVFDLAEAIHKELEEMEVESPPEAEKLVKWLKRAAEKSPHIQNAVLLKGTPPVPPVDGHIEWMGDFFNTGFVVDPETGAIDYRRRAAQLSVEENQSLAKLTPSKEGVPGRDVFGKRISVPKPKKKRIRVGQNVRVDKKTNAFYAAVGGRVRWVNDILFVDHVYTVKGSVGLETGHISHPGALVVEEDVLEGAEVESQGDIEVKGIVEAARIQTTGNLTVRCGITRCEDTVITVSGSVHVKFILTSQVEALGDVVAEREIVNSSVSTQGMINMPRGRIVGGKVKSFGNMVIGQVGTVANIPTMLVVGHAELIRPKQEAFEQAKDQLERVGMEIEALVGLQRPQTSESLQPPKQQAYEKLLARESGARHALKVLDREIEELRREEMTNGKRPVIEVHRVLNAGTTLCIDHQVLLVQEMYRGPIIARFADGKIEFSSP